MVESGSGAGYLRILPFFPVSNILPVLKTDISFTYHRQDSVDGIATRYGMDSRGIESRWGPDFPHSSRPTLGPTQPPIQRVPGLSLG